MGIISKGNAAVIGNHLRLVETKKKLGSNTYYVRVTCDSNDGGKKVRDIMKQYWEHGDGVTSGGPYFYTRSDDGNNSSLNNWKTFSVVPQLPPLQAQRACDEIVQELSRILEGVSDGTISPSNGESFLDPDPETTNETGGSGFKLGTTTYLIIGAAAAIIVLLLWDRKRK
jgi:hypothetical protein